MRCVLLLLIAASFPCPAKAQPPAVAPGARVRVTTVASTRMVGTLSRLSPDTLVLATAARTMALPVDIVRDVEVGTGRAPNTRKGAVIGAVVGGPAGVVWAVATGVEEEPEPDCDEHELICIGPIGPRAGLELKAALYGMVGAAGGALVGAAIGRLSHSERWLRVPLVVSVGLLPGRPGGGEPVPGLRVRVALP